MNARGQALTETLVATLVLVPMFMAVMWLARWQLVQERAQLATRQALLETFHAGESVDVARVTVRAREAARNVVASDVRSFEVDITRGAAPDALTDVDRAAISLLQPASLLGSGPFDLPAAGTWQITTVARADRPQALAFVDAALRFESRATVVVADVDARDEAAVLQRTASLSIAGRMRDAAEWLTPVATVLSLVEPAFEHFCPGRIDITIVPVDRLPGAIDPPSLRTQPC